MTIKQFISEDKQNKTSNYIDWIDITKGINIICVIIGHSFWGSKVQELIYSFHMPLFFLLSGYNIKKIDIRGLPKVTYKDFKRLYCPIFITIFLGCIIQALIFCCFKKGSMPNLSNVILGILWGNSKFRGSSYYLSCLWFLVALFWSKLFYRLVLLNIDRYRPIILLTLSYIVSICIKCFLPQCLDLIFIIMFFMDIGYILKENEALIIKFTKYIDIVVVFIWLYLVSEKQLFVDLAQREWTILGVFRAIMGSFSIIQISKGISNTRFLKYIFIFLGKYSLNILCIHYLQMIIGTMYLGA